MSRRKAVKVAYRPSEPPTFEPVIWGSTVTYYKQESDGHHHPRQVYFCTPKLAQEWLMDRMGATS